MPEPLLAEDTDLVRLVSRIREEHGPAASILYHDTVRRGGVMGFFAREVHRIAYQVEESPADSSHAVDAVDSFAAQSATAQSATDRSATDRSATDRSATDRSAAVRSAAVDTSRTPEASPWTQHASAALSPAEAALADWSNAGLFTDVDLTTPGAHGFLLPPSSQPVWVTPEALAPDVSPAADAPRGADIFAAQLASALQSEEPVWTLAEPTETVHPFAFPVMPADTPVIRSTSAADTVVSETVAEPVPAEVVSQPPSADPASAATPEAPRSRRSRGAHAMADVTEIGTRSGHRPRRSSQRDSYAAYELVTSLLAELTPAPELPRGAGEVIALVGPLAPALRSATALARQLRVGPSAVWLAGLEGHPLAELVGEDALPANRISGTRHARLLRSELRTADTASIVVVATDSLDAEPGDSWAADLLEAIEPGATWLLVDAMGKTSDQAAELRELPHIDALAVYNAQRSTSPASLLELDVPVALLDGRPATPFLWSALLLATTGTALTEQAAPTSSPTRSRHGSHSAEAATG